MLMLFTVALALLPALSVQVPDPDWLAPSLESTVSVGGLPAASPERESAQVKLTVTFVLFQPLAFGPGFANRLSSVPCCRC